MDNIGSNETGKSPDLRCHRPYKHKPKSTLISFPHILEHDHQRYRKWNSEGEQQDEGHKPVPVRHLEDIEHVVVVMVHLIGKERVDWDSP